MKTRKLILVAGVAVGLLITLELLRQKKVRKRLSVIADEGYETAEDILFPKRRSIRLA